MKEDAYLGISMAYMSVAVLTSVGLIVKGYDGYIHNTLHKNYRKRTLDYVLHCLHIPPYLIASYWYYDAYIHFANTEIQ